MLSLVSWAQQRAVMARRAGFFRRILDSVSEAPSDIDQVMGQAKYFVRPLDSPRVFDARRGTLVFHVRPRFCDREFEFFYSIWQLGRMLKIGVILQGDLEQAPLIDWHHEMSDLWAEARLDRQSRTGATLYEWTFDVPDLYGCWLNQERYILGMRHCHFRMLRIVHDFAVLTATED